MANRLSRKGLDTSALAAWLLVAGLVAWQLYVTGADATADGATLIRYGARKPNFHFPQAPWRLLASMFLHGGWVHLGANCIVIWLWGGRLCRLSGQSAFLAVFFLSGLWGSLMSDIYGPEALAVGASGGVAGLVLYILALAALAPGKPAWHGEAKSWLFSSAAAVALNVVMAMGLSGVAGGRLDHWAHIGGAAAGFLLGVFASRGGTDRSKLLWVGCALLAAAAGLVILVRGSTPFG